MKGFGETYIEIVRLNVSRDQVSSLPDRAVLCARERVKIYRHSSVPGHTLLDRQR